jgi:hypothetical protein
MKSGSVMEVNSGRQQSVSGGATGFSKRTLFGTIPACVIFALARFLVSLDCENL